MKKLFYIFASAIVALGAVACQNDIDENINTNEGVETLSFTANFDEATRVAFDENGKTCWVPGDQIEVVCEALGKTYTFTNSKADVNTFSCTEVGLSKIPGQEVTAIYSYGKKRAVDSAQGIAGSHLVATGRFPESNENSSLSFRLQNALLYFTAGVDVTFESNAEIFTVGGVSAKTLTVTAGNGTQYVAINPAENASFKYSVDGVGGKELTSFTFKAGTKYNLGELKVEKPKPAVLRIENLNGWNDLTVTIKSGSTTLVNAKPMTKEGNTNIFYYELDAKYIGTKVSYYINHSWYQTSTKEVTLAADSKPITLNTTYLEPGTWDWTSATFGAWFFGGSGEADKMVTAKKVKDNFFEVEIPGKTYKNVIFVRCNKNNATASWNTKWNQTGNLTLQHKCYCVNVWNNGGDTQWF